MNVLRGGGVGEWRICQPGLCAMNSTSRGRCEGHSAGDCPFPITVVVYGGLVICLSVPTTQGIVGMSSGESLSVKCIQEMSGVCQRCARCVSKVCKA